MNYTIQICMYIHIYFRHRTCNIFFGMPFTSVVFAVKCACVSIYLSIYLSIYIYICIYICVCVCVCMCVCVCARAYSRASIDIFCCQSICIFILANVQIDR